MGFAVVQALPSDAQALAALHARALPPGWPAADFAAYCADANRLVLKAVENEALLGLAVLQSVCGEAEILSIAVAPEARRRGAGSAMMAACVAICAERHVSCIFLEVAENNGAALKLYEKYGFGILSRRPDYYIAGRSAPEAALVMRLETKRPLAKE